MVKLLLAADTSSAAGSLALFDFSQSHANGTYRLLGDCSWLRAQSHAEVITLEMYALLEKCGVQLEHVIALGCGIGPGSFTGIRVGVNFIRSLAYALNLPVYVVNSLRLLAQSAILQEDVLCLQNAFRNKLYVAAYKKNGAEVIAPQAMTLSELKQAVRHPYLCLGAGYDDYRLELENHLPRLLLRSKNPQLSPLAKDFTACLNFSGNIPSPLSWQQLNPLYIRSSDAEEKLRSGVLKPVLKF